VIAEALSAKNSLSREAGYSPNQWVLGYEKALPGSVLDRPQDLAVHDLALQDDQFIKKLKIREQAKTAWIQLNNSERKRRAILQQPRLNHQQYYPGDVVFFYQLQRSRMAPGSNPDDPGCWHGPCIIIATEGIGNVWLTWHKTMVKVAAEHIRLATDEEHLGYEWVKEEVSLQKQHLEGGGAYARGYLDLAPSPPVPPTPPPPSPLGEDGRPLKKNKLHRKEKEDQLFVKPPGLDQPVPEEEVQQNPASREGAISMFQP
jgi:hypothetical protein